MFNRSNRASSGLGGEADVATFEEARAVVAAERAAFWPEEADYQVATWGLENYTHYQLYDGAYLALYEPATLAALKWLYPNDGEAVLVNKATGELEIHQGPDENGNLFKLPDATPCGFRP